MKTGKKHKTGRVILGCLALAAVIWGCKAASDTIRASGDDGLSHIVMTFQTMETSRLDHLDSVLEAVNAVSGEKIGVEVELLPVDAASSGEQYPLWITQDRQMDLMLINYQDITAYVDQSMLLPLDDLLEERGGHILSLSEDWADILSAGTVREQCYGVQIPPRYQGACSGLWFYQRYLDEAGIAWDEHKVYSLEELDAIFAALKEKHPEMYPLGQVTNPYAFSTCSFYLKDLNTLGSTVATGVLDETSPGHEILDLFETDAYVTWLKWIRQWYLDGYIYPEAAVTTSMSDELMRDGIVMSIPQSGMPFFFREDQFGEPLVCLRTTPVVNTPPGGAGIFWTIPETAQNPEAAMDFLNLMYTDEEIINLFQWGEEGEDYVFIGDGVVDYPEGQDANTVGYQNPLGVYGDQRLCYDFRLENADEVYEAYSAEAEQRGFEYQGFRFDTTPVNMEMIQVQKVLDRYLHVLEAGSEDLDTIYPQFIRELRDAGVDQVIAEKQRQLDEWLQRSDS